MTDQKFAARRKQYQQAQEAMRASESIIKGIRRELQIHIKEKKLPQLEAVLPVGKAKTIGAFKVELDSGGRNAAADKPFAVLVTGYKQWHDLTEREKKDIIRIMKEDGWNFASDDSTVIKWALRFN